MKVNEDIDESIRNVENTNIILLLMNILLTHLLVQHQHH